MPNENQMNNRLDISKGGNQLPAAHSCARGGPCKSSKVTISKSSLFVHIKSPDCLNYLTFRISECLKCFCKMKTLPTMSFRAVCSLANTTAIMEAWARYNLSYTF